MEVCRVNTTLIQGLVIFAKCFPGASKGRKLNGFMWSNEVAIVQLDILQLILVCIHRVVLFAAGAKEPPKTQGFELPADDERTL